MKRDAEQTGSAAALTPAPACATGAGATFESFLQTLTRLVEVFGRNVAQYKSAGYDEASLR